MRVSELKTEMDGRFVELKTDMNRRFVAVLEQISAEGDATRRYFDVIVEQFRAEVRLIYDKVTAIDDKLDRFAAENEQEHAIFRRALDDHEVRLKVVERHGQ